MKLMFVKTVAKCEVNNGQLMTKKSSSIGYERDSMERFGDDLTEQVIQYLWFSDKVMFECLSKQWQRLVFNKQKEIDINSIKGKNSLNLLRKEDNFDHDFYHNYELDRKKLISVLKKCPNISRVRFLNCKYDQDLDVITDYCRRVTKLIINNSYDEQTLISICL